MKRLETKKQFTEAIKWSRLYGGTVIFMLINNGRGLTEPVNYNNIREVEELRVYDRTEIFFDTSMSYKKPELKNSGKPEIY